MEVTAHAAFGVTGWDAAPVQDASRSLRAQREFVSDDQPIRQRCEAAELGMRNSLGVAAAALGCGDVSMVNSERPREDRTHRHRRPTVSERIGSRQDEVGTWAVRNRA